MEPRACNVPAHPVRGATLWTVGRRLDALGRPVRTRGAGAQSRWSLAEGYSLNHCHRCAAAWQRTQDVGLNAAAAQGCPCVVLLVFLWRPLAARPEKRTFALPADT